MQMDASSLGAPGHQNFSLQIGCVTARSGDELSMSLFVGDNRIGHIVVGIIPEDDSEETAMIFLDMKGLGELKRLIAQTEKTVDEASRAGRFLQLGYR